MVPYLYGRSQRVKVNGSLSAYEVILTGVPQGSLLGPLLFLIFVNDLPLSLKHTDSILYADDTVIYTKGKTAIEMAEKIKSDLVNLDTWCKQNNMLMNPIKTKLMLFGTHQVIKKLDRLEIEVNDTEFEYVSTYKYLGIYLDSILNFKKHLNMTLVSARHKLFVLKKIRPFIDKETSLLIYKTMVLPKLAYMARCYCNTWQ